MPPARVAYVSISCPFSDPHRWQLTLRWQKARLSLTNPVHTTLWKLRHTLWQVPVGMLWSLHASRKLRLEPKPPQLPVALFVLPHEGLLIKNPLGLAKRLQPTLTRGLVKTPSPFSWKRN